MIRLINSIINIGSVVKVAAGLFITDFVYYVALWRKLYVSVVQSLSH